MATEQFLGQIQSFGFGFIPVGWHACDGSLLSISQNDALFSLIGTTYGGDGVTTFAVPDLRGRVPIGMGNGQGLSPHSLGQMAGHETVTITTAQMPAHTHIMTSTTGGHFMVSDQPGISPTPDTTNNVIGAADDPTIQYLNSAYNNQVPNIALNTGATPPVISNSGGSMPFENMEPFLTINFCIAVQGIYPTRN